MGIFDTLAVCSIYGPVFKAIEERLKDRYRIPLQKHLGKIEKPVENFTIDPSLGGVIPALGGPRQHTIAASSRTPLVEGRTVLQGVTFAPASFQCLLELFREARDPNGERAFDYHPLKAAPQGGTLVSFLNYAEMLAYGDLLGLSYDQTKVGLTKATEKKAWGFREIALPSSFQVGPAEYVGTKPLPGQEKFSMKFGQAPGTYARRIDITSLHVALTPEACNIHIDNVGFVLRGPKSMAGMTPDFLQHLVNELLWKSIAMEAWKDSPSGLWVIEHLSIILPSSDNRYAPMLGLQLDKGNFQLSLALTVGCKCLPEENLTLEERIVPIREGSSIGVGFKVTF
jgi:hypothetical protein